MPCTPLHLRPTVSPCWNIAELPRERVLQSDLHIYGFLAPFPNYYKQILYDLLPSPKRLLFLYKCNANPIQVLSRSHHMKWTQRPNPPIGRSLSESNPPSGKISEFLTTLRGARLSKMDAQIGSFQ